MELISFPGTWHGLADGKMGGGCALETLEPTHCIPWAPVPGSLKSRYEAALVVEASPFISLLGVHTTSLLNLAAPTLHAANLWQVWNRVCQKLTGPHPGRGYVLVASVHHPFGSP